MTRCAAPVLFASGLGQTPGDPGQPFYLNCAWESCDESDPDVEDTEYKPQSKRQKTNAKSNITKEQKVRRVRGQGKLQMIVDMPLDILYETFLYLCPLDILRLSRMSKALSHILMTRNVEFIWRQARLNLEGLPECPVDLNEYQYAKLMFDPTCNCLIKPTNRSQGPPVEIYGEVARIVPSVGMGSGREDVHPSNNKLFYCKATAAQLRDEYWTLQGDDQLLWLIKKQQERQRRIEHGRLCEKWMARKSQKRLSYLDMARTRRLDASLTSIKAKLIELGWEEELKLFGQRLNELPSVKQPKDLTDRIWKNIKPDIIKLLEDHKTRRLEEEYKSAQQDRASRLARFLNSYRDAQPLCNRIIPFFTDIVKMQPLVTLMNPPTAESIEFTDALLREAVQDWRRLKDAELVDIMGGSLPDTDKNNTNALFLATTFFSNVGDTHATLGTQ
ncbi:hypothetical protein D9615_001939 [Tricholomella constricta]|uniref:F-box domain-containing protein n=1 Tax=Tricholomella constricta TaxID=117010 RepID=A0A8H5MA87_9AGAR|nr:hypothetical protein D9615_001939 [Tricholomella constricta]